jgi:hypothetical protein
MINSVRNTVLSVLNKNNYGYITPADFNLYAKQAQLELYEGYFAAYNKAVNLENARVSGSDYANTKLPISEALEYFLVTDELLSVSDNKWFAPSLSTTGSNAFMILRVECMDSNGDRMATAEKVSMGKIAMLNDSNLTAPTLMYPAYTYESSSTDDAVITLYPSTISDANNNTIDCIYFRLPKDPKWTYVNITNGEPMFDQSQPDYQDFELPLEDEYKLVVKILQYCGVSIREQEVTAYALGQEQQQQQ